MRGGRCEELARGEGGGAGPSGGSGRGTLCQSSDVQEGVASCCEWQGGVPVTAVKVYIHAVHVYINAAHAYISLRLPSLCTMRRTPLAFPLPLLRPCPSLNTPPPLPPPPPVPLCRHLTQLKADQVQLAADLAEIKGEVERFIVLGGLKQVCVWGVASPRFDTLIPTL